MAISHLVSMTICVFWALLPGCGSSGTSGDAAADAPDEDELALCGNGIVDEGEECDDGNRMDGDGCDWSCRWGNGDPPDPEPDPSTPPVEQYGTGVTLVEGDDVPLNQNALDLKWNGRQYSLIYFYDNEAGIGTSFRRFDAAGSEMISEWDLLVGEWNGSVTVDHVWNGLDYGLFYGNRTIGGIWFVRVGETGKLLSEPRLIVPVEDARHHSVAWTGSSYGMAWFLLDNTPDGMCAETAVPSYFGTFDEDGNPSIPSVHADDLTTWPPYLAWSDDRHFHSTSCVVDNPDDCVFTVREVTFAEEGTPLHTTNIGPGRKASIASREDAYAVALFLQPTGSDLGDPGKIVLARFTGAGALSEPPYVAMEDARLCPIGLKLVPDPYGYGLLWCSETSPLHHTNGAFLARLDPRGRMVGEEIEVSSGGGAPEGVSQFDGVWGDGGFAVAYSIGDAVFMKFYR